MPITSSDHRFCETSLEIHETVGKTPEMKAVFLRLELLRIDDKFRSC